MSGGLLQGGRVFELLKAGREDYVINEAALAYMREHKLPQATIARFGDAEQRFAGRKAFMAHLQKLCLTDLTVQPDPVQIATEAALWGSIDEQGLVDGTVIVSDGAGQFRDRGARALLGAFGTPHSQARYVLQGARPGEGAHPRPHLAPLQESQGVSPGANGAPRHNLSAASTPSFPPRRASPELERLLERLRAQRVLKHPDIPLLTNGSENDIRRDAFLWLMKTCTKQAISFWDYLGDRLGVLEAPAVPRLADLVRQHADVKRNCMCDRSKQTPEYMRKSALFRRRIPIKSG